MKADRTTLWLQLILNGALLLGLVLSGIGSYSLSSGYPCNSSSELTLHKIFLVSSILFVVVLAAANLLFSKFRNQPSHDIQHVDHLTGFMTRHAFGEVFEHTLLDAKRSLEPLSVLLVNIDHFRRINERHGHQIGDEVLIMLSESIQSVLRASDITCRWEGDQILVVLQECSTKDSCRIAVKMMEKIRSQTLERGKEKINITTSIGIAQMVSSDTIETLAARAETGLHSARDNGRNTYAIGYDWILIEYCCDPIF
jgi:diguanylate cyclase (GGDEF)-like protein